MATNQDTSISPDVDRQLKRKITFFRDGKQMMALHAGEAECFKLAEQWRQGYGMGQIAELAQQLGIKL